MRLLPNTFPVLYKVQMYLCSITNPLLDMDHESETNM